jgi:NAD(P)-dependent dehydrogenase (short-subunit alcohol dehydrogenase family)
VITGAGSGIGLAAAKAFARLSMNVCLADLPGAKLDRAAEEVAKAVGGTERVRAMPTNCQSELTKVIADLKDERPILPHPWRRSALRDETRAHDLHR